MGALVARWLAVGMAVTKSEIQELFDGVLTQVVEVLIPREVLRFAR